MISFTRSPLVFAAESKLHDKQMSKQFMDEKRDGWAAEEARMRQMYKEAAESKLTAQEKYRRKMNALYWQQQSDVRQNEAQDARHKLSKYRHDALEVSFFKLS